MIQGNLFGEEFAPKIETKYTSKIKAPVYEPKNQKPQGWSVKLNNQM
jgi:hypothetical protein